MLEILKGVLTTFASPTLTDIGSAALEVGIAIAK